MDGNLGKIKWTLPHHLTLLASCCIPGRKNRHRFRKNHDANGAPYKLPQGIARLISFFIVSKNAKKHFLAKHSCLISPISAISYYEGSIGHPIQRIQAIQTKIKTKRVNLVTDSLTKKALFGDLAASLFFAIYYCKRYKHELRIITRLAHSDISELKEFIEFHDLTDLPRISFCYDDGSVNNKKIEIGQNDVFMATSWWSAAAIRSAFPEKKFIYILQEVEPYFYPHGISYYLSSAQLHEPNVFYIVNQPSLYEHLIKNKMIGHKNVSCFKSAYSRKLSKNFKKDDMPNKKRQIFFYARPNNPQNMLPLGLFLLEKAIQFGVIDTNNWDIYFADQNTPDIVFSNGYRPIQKNIQSLEEYCDFLHQTDLVISLTCSPYAPHTMLDALAAGNVVLTNSFGNKQPLGCSANAIITSLDLMQFLTDLSKAVALSIDLNTREQNYQNQTMNHDWSTVFTEAFQAIEEFL